MKSQEGESYGTDINLGTLDGLEILTFTSEEKLNYNPPSKLYLDVLKEGLKDQRSLFELYDELRKTQSHRTAIQTLQEIKRFYQWLSQKGYHYEFSEQAFKKLKKKKEFENRARKYFTECVLPSVRGFTVFRA